MPPVERPGRHVYDLAVDTAACREIAPVVTGTGRGVEIIEHTPVVRQVNIGPAGFKFFAAVIDREAELPVIVNQLLAAFGIERC